MSSTAAGRGREIRRPVAASAAASFNSQLIPQSSVSLATGWRYNLHHDDEEECEAAHGGRGGGKNAHLVNPHAFFELTGTFRSTGMKQYQTLRESLFIECAHPEIYQTASNFA